MGVRIIVTEFADQEIRDWVDAQPGSESDRELLTAEILKSLAGDFRSRPNRILPRSEPIPAAPAETYRCEVYDGVWLWYRVERSPWWRPWQPERVTITRFG
jgi:hypothetical protein